MGCERYKNEPGVPDCCFPCHEDFEAHGYDMCSDPYDSMNSVCCKVSTWLRARQQNASTQVRHGIDCEKKPHTRGGELHAEDDDRPYDVDGVKYCGRCHQAL
jgi:hypothetical protein